MKEPVGRDNPAAAAAFAIEEAQEFLQRLGVGGIPEILPFPAHGEEVLVSEFLEMMGQCGPRDAQLRLDVPDHHALGVS
jgi:hypothetical protein